MNYALDTISDKQPILSKKVHFSDHDKLNVVIYWKVLFEAKKPRV
tara:strand:+ start:385 stop:519 length:135 start_codon:yes stop_codon:yes gene_type:complete